MTAGPITFAVRHFALEEGPGSVAIVDGAGAASAPTAGDVESLRDGQAGDVVTWAAADRVQLLRAAGDPIGALYLGPEHNATAVQVQDGLGGDLLPTLSGLTPGQPYWLVFPTPSSATELRLILTPDSGDARLGELLLTEAPLALVGGPVPDWTDEEDPTLEVTRLASGADATLQTGPPVREMAYTFTQAGLATADATADQAVFALLAGARAAGRPIVHRGPWQTSPPVWARLTRLQRRTDNPRRGVNEAELYRYRVDLRAHTL